MNIIDFMLLIMTTVAAIALIQAHFSAKFEQSGKLSCLELKLFRVGGAVYLPFELWARKFIWKRLLCFIRAVKLPTPEAAVYRHRDGIRAVVGNVQYTLSKSGKTIRNIIDVKLLVLFCVFLFCLSCGKKNEAEFDGQSLQGTRWKLAGIVDTKTGKLTIIDPKDCDTCYSFTFDTDSTAAGKSITNHLFVRLNAKVQIHIATEILDCHVGNCSLFYDAIQLVVSHELKNNELKFYYNDNKNFLLFKLLNK